jgi:DnaJ-class molecular chaperone
MLKGFFRKLGVHNDGSKAIGQLRSQGVPKAKPGVAGRTAVTFQAFNPKMTVKSQKNLIQTLTGCQYNDGSSEVVEP